MEDLEDSDILLVKREIPENKERSKRDIYQDSTIAMAALGRPFTLGGLYDCHDDTLIPGIGLWTQEQMTKQSGAIREINKESTKYDISSDDTQKAKMDLLHVEARLKVWTSDIYMEREEYKNAVPDRVPGELD